MSYQTRGSGCKKTSIAIGIELKSLVKETHGGVDYVIYNDVMHGICAALREAFGSRFNEERFRNFVKGTHGPNGGLIKKDKKP